MMESLILKIRLLELIIFGILLNVCLSLGLNKYMNKHIIYNYNI
jgi:hypothetical protein